ncbi:MAG: aminotransferase class I/II-fold pyridoxal phosphate-dependent enzyme [Actinobacteria bacterium]|nr:MAG: aminotransferase class I/II-fold pyridoxal phosphate-dependent enzyme [Actinomycetota bacterium]
MKHIYDTLNHIKGSGLYPKIKTVAKGSTQPIITIDNKDYINFCSNNYLGLSTHPEVIQSSIEAAREHGIGPGTSRLLSGNLALLEELELKVSQLVQTEAAITIPTGYIANSGIISALLDPMFFTSDYKRGSGILISDESNHASIADGYRQSYTKLAVFKHNDLTDLEEKLSNVDKEEPKLIVTEGVFSLEAELAPLPGIVELAKKYGAMVLIDDAHSIGILGDNGGGTVQHFGLEGQVDIIMGSFSKALGGMGGFLAGKKELIDYLRITLRPYIYSSPISAPVAGGLIKAIELSINDNSLRQKLFSNYNYIYDKIKLLNFDILGNGVSPVLPLMLYDDMKAVSASEKLFNKGILIESFRSPAVPPNTARMRIVPTALHEQEHLDVLIEALSGIIK